MDVKELSFTSLVGRQMGGSLRVENATDDFINAVVKAMQLEIPIDLPRPDGPDFVRALITNLDIRTHYSSAPLWISGGTKFTPIVPVRTLEVQFLLEFE